MKETYLGDGCYASFDGFQFCLRSPREESNHLVYLEPVVLAHFLQYVLDVRAAMKADKPIDQTD